MQIEKYWESKRGDWTVELNIKLWVKQSWADKQRKIEKGESKRERLRKEKVREKDWERRK
jgi:hypothetical protein